jgi:hypothetical protein
MRAGSVKDFDLDELKVIRRALGKLLWQQDNQNDPARQSTAALYSRISRQVYRLEHTS